MIDTYDSALNFTAYDNFKFFYFDYEEENNKKINEYLTDCVLQLKQFEKYEFNNSLERFLKYFDFAYRINKSNISGDFFCYKFKGLMIHIDLLILNLMIKIIN
jgi:hypothetical protein